MAEPQIAKLTIPRKYWWVVVVIMPIALAVIPLLLKREGKQEPGTSVAISGGTVTGSTIIGTDLSTHLSYTTSVTVIQQEAAAKGQPLTEQQLKQIQDALKLLDTGRYSESAASLKEVSTQVSSAALENTLGVAYAKTGDRKAATAAYGKALQLDPNYQPAHFNLASANVERGELSQAASELEKAKDVKESKALATAVQEELKKEVHDRELEPNDDALKANAIPLEKTVEATIAENSDSDFFRFTTPPKCRDIIEVQIANRSTTLAPAITLFDSNKSKLADTANGTAGANLGYSFSATPATSYYIQVSGRGAYGGSSGAYRLTVKPLKKYDAFEPNDDILHASPIELGKEVTADIMDPPDADFYRIKSAGNVGTMKLIIANHSTTLAPAIVVFDSSKSKIAEASNGTAGANLERSFPVKAGETYYTQVTGGGSYGGSPGGYTLSLSQE